MRPQEDKCDACDFKALCPQQPEDFATIALPPEIHLPDPLGTRLARAFSQFER
jgi:DNA helicase-2/ATP-dependent DNA helicase PcrA